MDELSLIVEGITNKIRKLTLQNKKLQQQILELQDQQARLNDSLYQQVQQNDQLEQRLQQVQVGKALSTQDSFQAKQKVNELLREVEKCYALLNR
ncbi:MAG: hypothetical protein R6U64_00400 [Bacteroidales bacterium]